MRNAEDDDFELGAASVFVGVGGIAMAPPIDGAGALATLGVGGGGGAVVVVVVCERASVASVALSLSRALDKPHRASGPSTFRHRRRPRRESEHIGAVTVVAVLQVQTTRPQARRRRIAARQKQNHNNAV